MDRTGNVGVPGSNSVFLSLDEHATLAEAVRESVRRSTAQLLDHVRPARPEQAAICPSCGDRVIHLDAPDSFVFDVEQQGMICRACAAERDFFAMVLPDADIGGEGG